MKKILHKLSAVILVIAIIVCALPLNVYAAEGAEFIDTVYFKNAKTSRYLSLNDNSDTLGNYMNAAAFGIDKVNIVMKVKKLGNNFLIQPAKSTVHTIAPTSLTDGAKITMQLSNGAPVTQWKFSKTATGNYTIHPANAPTFCLAINDSGKVVLQTYKADALNQQWQASKFTLRKEGENAKALEYGIDVSQWQADINWQAVKEYGVDFAILRLGYSGETDLKFEQNFAAAKEQGIKLGVYIYSYALSVEEAEDDARQVLNTLGARAVGLEYPIFFDIEDDSQAGFTKRKKTDMCLAFIKIIKDAGCNVGVYANRNWFEEHIYREEIELAGADIWRAQYLKTDRASEDYAVLDKPEVYSDVDIWQFRSDGRVAGIEDDVDMNVAFKDYSNNVFVYTGEPITPKYPMYDELGNLLVEGVDYSITYMNNVNVGKGFATITGINKFVGKLYATREFNIIAKSIDDAKITGATNTKRYTGAYIKPLKKVKVVLGNKTLKYGTDYTISYKNNKNVGTASLTITGIGNYSGSRSFNFKITKAKLSSATITGIENKVHTGSARKLSLKVKLEGTTLKSGKDYTVSYKNNVNFGTATVTIKAKGSRVSGTVKKTFKIVPQAPKLKKVTNQNLNSVTLNWTHSDYATKYQLYRATSKDGKYKCVYQSPDRWTYAYTNKKLKEGTHYYYKIRSYIKVNGKKYYSAFSDVKKTNTKLSDTTFKTKRSKKKGTVTITIQENVNVSKYIVYISEKETSGFKKVWSGTELTYTHEGLEKGKTYYVRVRTYKKTANGTVYGAKTRPKKIVM